MSALRLFERTVLTIDNLKKDWKCIKWRVLEKRLICDSFYASLNLKVY
jgi:hypothetical protein